MKRFSINLFGLHAHLKLTWESPEATRFRRGREFPKNNIYFEGDYPNWDTALKAAGGYDAPQILNKSVSAMRQVRDGKAKYERDTVVFDHVHLSYPLLSWLLYVASCSSGRLSVMDFGGALGSSYYQNRGFLAQLSELRWGVVEQHNFVTAGLAEFQTNTLRFFYTPDECESALQPNFLLFSGVLQYMEYPMNLLDSLLEKETPYVLIDRTMAHRLGSDRLAVQHVPAWIYKASYPVWFLDAAKLERCFERHGYDVIDTFDPHVGATFGMEGFSAPYMGWFLKKRSV